LRNFYTPEQEAKVRIEIGQLRRENNNLRRLRELDRKKINFQSKEIKLLKTVIRELQGQNKQLKKRIEKLELNQKTYAGMLFKAKKKDKDNGDRPSDISSPSRGGKSGHKGNSRHVPQRIDKVVKVDKFKYCPDCGERLTTQKRTISHIVEDVVLPLINTQVIKYEKTRQYCPHCKEEKINKADDEVPNSRFGVNLSSLLLYLRYESKLSLPLIVSLLKSVAGIEVTDTGLQSQLEIASKKLGNSYRDILKDIRSSPIIHADETGWRVDGENYWAWNFSNKDITYLGIAPSRGKGVVDDYLGGAGKDSVLIRDGYAAYDHLKMKQQYCWSHILRYARDFAKLEGSSDQIRSLSKSLDRLYKKVRDSDPEYYEEIFADLIRLAEKETDCEACARVQLRIRKQAKGLLTGLLIKGVPLTNNQAERDLRPLVIMRKLSGGSRSEDGAEITAINYSIIQTLKKKKLDILSATKKLLLGTNLSSLSENA
jgi:transposase